METKINLIDRITIQSIMPEKGNLKQLIIRKDIKKKVQITQKEIEDFEIRFDETRMMLNQKGLESEFEIEFSDLESKEIKSILSELNNKGELTEQLLNLCETFKVE